MNTVVIATRHHLHAAQVLKALIAGKHVFCEKPLCLTEDELAQIISVHEKPPSEGKPLAMLGFNRRFAPLAIELKSFLVRMHEPLAMHYRINAGCFPPNHWVNDPEQGGGRILGEICHFVDFMSYLADAPAVEISTHALDNGAGYSGENVVQHLHLRLHCRPETEVVLVAGEQNGLVRQNRAAPIPVCRAFAAEGFEIPDLELAAREISRRNGQQVVGPRQGRCGSRQRLVRRPGCGA